MIVPPRRVASVFVACLGLMTALVVDTSDAAANQAAGLVSANRQDVPAAGTAEMNPEPRILDTRLGVGAGSAIGAGQTIQIQVAGRGGVPDSGVRAVALNVTATGSTTSGYLTVYGSGSPRPGTSNLNVVRGVTVPNLVISRVSASGKLSIYNDAGSTHVIADVQGWFSDDGGYTALSPRRVVDTRVGLGPTRAAVGPGQTMDVRVAGVAGVPTSGVGAVVLNVTATEPSQPGYLAVFPSSTSRPTASNLNFETGQTVANLAIARVGANGKVSVYNNSGSTHVVIDVLGWFSEQSYSGILPERALDTRIGAGAARAAVGPGRTIDVQVTGVAGVPTRGVGAVVLNVTATEPSASSYVSVSAARAPRRVTSNLNVTPGQTATNLVIAGVGPGGKVSIHNSSGTTHVVADIQGWFPLPDIVSDPSPTPVAPPPVAGHVLPYSSDSFFRSSARGAPVDADLTSRFHSFMATHPDQRGVGYPAIRGVGGNRWGTPFAVGRPGDVRWTLTGSIPEAVADLRTEGFYAPQDFGASITGTSDSPFVVYDRVRGQSVWGAKAVVKPGYVIEVAAAGRFMHTSNGLDMRNPRSDDARNFRSRGAIPDAMVIRRDLMDAAIAAGGGLGHVLHLFIVESDSSAGAVHPMVGAESGKNGFGAEGTRIVLRPDFPVESLSTPEAKVLARTLIEHGMYIGDNAGSGSSLKAQQDVNGQVWGSRLTADTLKGLDWTDFLVITPGWQ